MRGIIRYYISGNRNPIIKYVDDLKFLGLLNEAADCPVDPDHIDKVSIYADFNMSSKEDKNDKKNEEA